MRVLDRRWRPTPGGGTKTGRQRRHEARRSGGCSSRALALAVMEGEVLGFGFWRLVSEVRCWALWRLVSGGCWVSRRWVLILWVLAAGEWWVLRGSFFFFFFFCYWETQLNGNFLGSSRKTTKTTLWWRKHDGEGFFFFFFLWWIFSSSRLTVGCFKQIDVCSDTKYDAG